MMNGQIEKEDSFQNLVSYYRCQENICLRSELFGEQIVEHGSKVITLFAEIFSYMVDNYGINSTTSLMIEYENSEPFKHWFWRIKHILGQKLMRDPTFYDIGKWIGQGFFLKIVISLIQFKKFYLDESIILDIIERQKKLLEGLIKENYFCTGDTHQAIEFLDDGYRLLSENIILEYRPEFFYQDNII